MMQPNDNDRAAAIAEGHGYWYALLIDRCARDDTRAAAIAEGYGYYYALYVDRYPRADTREAACRAGLGYEYARDIDRYPHTDAHAAAPITWASDPPTWRRAATALIAAIEYVAWPIGPETFRALSYAYRAAMHGCGLGRRYPRRRPSQASDND